MGLPWGSSTLPEASDVAAARAGRARTAASARAGRSLDCLLMCSPPSRDGRRLYIAVRSRLPVARPLRILSRSWSRPRGRKEDAVSIKRGFRMTAAVLAAVAVVGWGVSFACDHEKEVAKTNGKTAAAKATPVASEAAVKEAAPCAGKDIAAHADGKPCPFATAAAEGKPCPHAAKAELAMAAAAAPCPHAAKAEQAMAAG